MIAKALHLIKLITLYAACIVLLYLRCVSDTVGMIDSLHVKEASSLKDWTVDHVPPGGLSTVDILH